VKKALRLVVALTLAALIAGCGSGGSFVPFASERPRSDKALFDEGTRLLADKNTLDAIERFDILIKLYPDSESTGRAKLVLDDCALSQECNFYLAQIKALPPGGGMIFYPNIPDEPH
jgi:outer membrane protein assembly factor BamD (BamD/ComL family)